MSFLVAELQAAVCPPLAGKPTEFSTCQKARTVQSVGFRAPDSLRPVRSAKYSVRSGRAGRSPRDECRNRSDRRAFRLQRFPAAASRNFVPETSGVSDLRRDLVPVSAWSAHPQIQKWPACICQSRMGAKDRRPEIAPGQRTTPHRSRQIPPTSSGKNDRPPSPNGEFAECGRHLSPCNGQELNRATSRREHTRSKTQKSI